MLDILAEYTYCLIYVIVLTRVIIYLSRQKIDFKRIIFALPLYTIINCIITSANTNGIIEFISINSIALFFDYLYLSFLMRGFYKYNIFYVTLYGLFNVFNINSIIHIVNIVDVFNRQATLSLGIQRFIMVLTINFFTGCFLVSLKVFNIIPNKDIIDSQNKLYNMLNIIVLYSMMIIYNIGIFEIVDLIMLFVFLLLILWVMFLKVLTMYVETTIKNEELIMEEMSNKYISKYLEFCRRESDNLRKLKHDLKNHKDILEQIDKFNNYNQYIDDIFNDIDINHIQTGNIYIDSCLYAKQEEYSDIIFDFDISVADLKINEKDITSLLFNLIDNACHEALKTDKIVKLKIKYINGFLIVEVKNKCINNPKFISTKGTEHGYGLRIINGIVNKYSGDLFIEYSDDQVTFNIKIST